jgi:hypothetical protein
VLFASQGHRLASGRAAAAIASRPALRRPRLAIPAASVTTMSGARAGQEGLASGLLMTAQEVGTALGIAALSAVAAASAGQAPGAGMVSPPPWRSPPWPPSPWCGPAPGSPAGLH